MSIDQDGPCYYCGKPTNSFVANPGLWPVFLCHAEDPGVTKAHHEGCVMERLDVLAAEQAKVRALREALAMADRLCEEALPKFDWGKSPLNANAIKLLNEVPGAIKRALATTAPEPAKCPECGGSDPVWVKHNGVCPACKGTGKAQRRREDETIRP